MPKTVVVSGGSRGLGQAIVQEFINDTCFAVATFSRSSSSFLENLALNKEISSRFHFEKVDLQDRATINAFVRHVREHFGSIDILINNAGLALDDVLALERDNDIDLMLNINLKGTVTLTKACVREMLPRQWGRIINITSIVGKTGYRGLSIYSLTKAGLDGFTRSLARELGGRRITVNSVAPGFIETEMTHGLSEQQLQQIVRRTPAGRIAKPNDVVPLILFLCSDKAAFITGQTIVVDGGLTA